MSRTTYVYVSRPGGGVDVFVKGEEPEETRAAHNILAGDRHYDGLQASDGSDISTRTKHREYMRRNNLTMAEDYKNTWAQAEKARQEYRTGQRGSVTRDDIARALHQHLHR